MYFHIDKSSNIQMIISKITKFAKDNCSNKNTVSETIILSSEIIYNILKFSPKGEFHIHIENNSFKIKANDIGEGFSREVENVVKEGYSTVETLGLGIPSIIRMADKLNIVTSKTGTIIECSKDF